jgi:hypothetical protein
MVHLKIRKYSIVRSLGAFALVAMCASLPSTVHGQSQPARLLCFQDDTSVELTWNNNAVYDSLTVLRDGDALAQIEGDDERFVDLNSPCGPRSYQIQATVGGEVLPLSDESGNEFNGCSLDVICPVTSLTCTAETAGDGRVDVELNWVIGDEYDEILIRRDGITIDAIAASSNGYTDVNVRDGILRYVVTARVEGVVVDARCDLSVFRIGDGPAPGPKILASVDLAVDDASAGLENLRIGFNDGENQAVACGSANDTRDARQNLGSINATADRFFYFQIDDPDVRGLSNVLVAAIVFDAPDIAGTQLFLESVDPRSSGDNLIYQRANQIHELRGSGDWATLYWNLPGGTLGPAGDGALPDFRIGVMDDTVVCLDEVVVLDNSLPSGAPNFQRGDLNGDHKADISDVVVKLMFIYGVGPSPECLDAADFNDDGFLGPDGALFMLFWVFGGSTPPPDPGPPGLSVCGPDPTIDNFPKARCVTASTCE